MRILSLCTSAGLWDRAWLDAGHQIIPGCEIVEYKRAMFRIWCREAGAHLCHDINDLPDLIRGQHFDGIIGGPPCQSLSVTKAMRPPKFGDLTLSLKRVLAAASFDWFLFENVLPLDLGVRFKGTVTRLDAMNFARPHQSRRRYFTHSENIPVPKILFPGDVDDLMAYPAVAARLYGPKRGARLQGWPDFAALPFLCDQIQVALADGLPRGLAMAWIRSIESI